MTKNSIRNTIYKYKFLFAFIILLSIIICIYTALLEKGFCYKTGTFLSELDQEELINRGIKRVITNIVVPEQVHHYALKGDYEFIDLIIPYNSVKEFKLLNPNCCSFRKELGGDWFREPLINKIIGEVYGYIYLEYIALREYPNDIPKELEHLYPLKVKSVTAYPVDTCGKLKESRKG